MMKRAGATWIASTMWLMVNNTHTHTVAHNLIYFDITFYVITSNKKMQNKRVVLSYNTVQEHDVSAGIQMCHQSYRGA